MKGKPETLPVSRGTSLADDVLREVWRVRDEISASYGHDIGKLCAALRERQKKSGRRVIGVSELYGIEPAASVLVREKAKAGPTACGT